MQSVDLMSYSVVSVMLFCIGCYFLMSAVREKVPVYNKTGFSKKALVVKKSYKVFSWSVMTCFFLGALVISFYQVFTEL